MNTQDSRNGAENSCATDCTVCGTGVRECVLCVCVCLCVCECMWGFVVVCCIVSPQH
jgi:hypothetical protein